MPQGLCDLAFQIAGAPRLEPAQLALLKISDDFELKMISLFKMAKRELNIDQIQAAYFRKYNEYKERTKITAKLYNMARSSNSAIESVKGRKGVYKLKDNFEE